MIKSQIIFKKGFYINGITHMYFHISFTVRKYGALLLSFTASHYLNALNYFFNSIIYFAFTTSNIDIIATSDLASYILYNSNIWYPDKRLNLLQFVTNKIICMEYVVYMYCVNFSNESFGLFS